MQLPPTLQLTHVDSCAAEIAVLAYLTAAVWRANEVLKSQVALKEGRSMWLCPFMGGAAAAHTAAFLLLYKQQLWRNLIMMPLGINLGGVSIFPQQLTCLYP